VLAADAVFRGEVTTVEETRRYIETHVRATVRDLARLSNTLRISVRRAGVRVAFHRKDTPEVPPAEVPLYSVAEEPPEFM
jgi:hypothetical protein